MKDRYIHLAVDEKFINSAYFQFEQIANGLNNFFVLLPNKDIESKYVDPKKGIEFLYDNYEDKEYLLNQIKCTDIVFLHSLSTMFYDIILKIPKSVKIIWFCFGFEVYNDLDYFLEKEILAPLTLKAFPSSIKKKYTKKNFKDSLRPFLRRFDKNLALTPYEIKRKVLNRINFLGSPFEEEFRTVCYRLKIKKKYFPFSYYPINQIIDIDKVQLKIKKNILVGNSSFKTGNHLDVFDQLKKKNLSVFNEIIVPLSYGDKLYCKKITEVGKTMFGDFFIPLTSFKNIHEYNKILDTIGVAIFYNKRQQAIGNVISLLWFGCKIFLSYKNPFYKFLIRKEVIIFSFEHDFNNKDALKNLSAEQSKNNRIIMNELFSQKYLIKRLANQLIDIE